MKVNMSTIILILVIVVVIVIIYLVIRPIEVNDYLTKERMQCNFNIRAITEEIIDYVEEHGVFPDNLNEVFGAEKTDLYWELTGEKYSLLCPLSGDEYIYSKPRSLDDRDYDILYCPAHKIKKTLRDFEEDRKALHERRSRIGI